MALASNSILILVSLINFQPRLFGAGVATVSKLTLATPLMLAPVPRPHCHLGMSVLGKNEATLMHE